MDNKKSVRKRIISIVLFVAALCFSLIEIHAVALTNGGYGVLDMTKYNSDVFVKMKDPVLCDCCDQRDS